METDDSICDAIRDSFSSANVCDPNLEPSNIVDVIHYVNSSINLVAIS